MPVEFIVLVTRSELCLPNYTLPTFDNISLENNRRELLVVFDCQSSEKTSDHRTVPLSCAGRPQSDHLHMKLNNAKACPLASLLFLLVDLIYVPNSAEVKKQWNGYASDFI